MGIVDVVTKERLAQGLSYDEFKARMTRNQDRFEANERRVVLSDADLAPFGALAKPLTVLVLAEDWCGDVVANLPILGRIAKEAGTLDLRVFFRDQNKDLMSLYLNRGIYESIPVFAFFDEDLEPVGLFTERPDSVTALRRRKREELYATYPEFGPVDGPVQALPDDVQLRLREGLARIRDETAEFANREMIRELRAIVAPLVIQRA